MSAPVPLTRARWITLALGVPLALAIIGFTAFTGVAQVGQASAPVAETITPGGLALTLRIDGGTLTLVPSADGRVHVNGTTHYSLVQPSVRLTTTAAGVTLAAHCGNLPGNCEFDYTVSVPTGVSVTARDGAGDIRLRGLANRLDLRASDGNVTATGLAGTVVTASSGTGDVSLTFSRPPTDVQAHSGQGDVAIAVPGLVTYAVAASAPAGTADIGVRTSPTSTRRISASSSTGAVRVIPTPPG